MLTFFPVHGSHDPNWLVTTLGEILRTTNEEPQNQPWNYYRSEFKGTDRYSFLPFDRRFKGIQQIPAYKAVNNAGKVGCECTFRFPFIHPFLFFLLLLSSLPPVVWAHASTWSSNHFTLSH